jgi:hypothetical protein
MIASVHLADVGPARALRLGRRRLTLDDVAGIGYSQLMTRVPLSPGIGAAPELGRVGLFATWESEDALDAFLDRGHPVAEQLSSGWHVRLQPTRAVGDWAEMLSIVDRDARPMDADEPAAVLTLGRLRLRHVVRFKRASAPAEGLALKSPDLLAATAFAQPPRVVATFSLWSTVSGMRAYAEGRTAPGHRDAVRAHTKRAFHHESVFIRFRPYGARGQWDGREPLSELATAAAGAAL